jgi:hypothetical protein
MKKTISKTSKLLMVDKSSPKNDKTRDLSNLLSDINISSRFEMFYENILSLFEMWKIQYAINHETQKKIFFSMVIVIIKIVRYYFRYSNRGKQKDKKGNQVSRQKSIIFFLIR